MKGQEAAVDALVYDVDEIPIFTRQPLSGYISFMR